MHSFLARQIVFPLQERLKGKNTFKLLRQLEESQWSPPRELEDIQFRRLQDQLTHAYRTVPYYRRLFSEHGLPPEKIKDWSDFKRLPCLTRDVLRDQFEQLRSTNPVRGTQRMSTGGSTGQPVAVLVDSVRNSFIDAARLRVHRWYDADVGAKEIVLWGSPIEVTRQDYVRNFRDRLLNSRLLSAFDLGSEKLAEYANCVNSERPAKIYGYASAIYLLAQHFESTGKMPPESIKVIFATAEPLFDFQRKTIEKVFRAKVSCEYGARDAGLMANECPAGGLHVPIEGMVVEIENHDSTGAGEVVVTNLFAKAMPIIRYRTGDVAELSPNPCACGRGLPVLKTVAGRQTDFIVTPENRVVHALALIYVLRECPDIDKFQVIQESPQNILVKVVARPQSPPNMTEGLVRKLQKVLGLEMEIEVALVPTIPTSPSGKFRYVTSKVAVKNQ